ncbi:MAG: sensor histidine kinase [Lentimicrobium sp.]
MNNLRATTLTIPTETISAGETSGAFLKIDVKLRTLISEINEWGQSFNLLPLRHFIKSWMFNGVFRNVFLRFLLFLVVSFPLKLMLDVIFGLVYRNYAIFRPAEEYLGAAILTLITLETLMLVKRRLNMRLLWEKNPLRRLVVEISVNTFLFSAFIVLLSLGIKYFIIKVQFIQFSDEVLIAIFYLILLVYIPAFIEFAVFLLNRWRISLAEMERYKKENAEYRFETLRTQVNPHFLFNSLNTLSSLMYEDREKASGFIRDLSDVYRYVLENRNRETISLQEEVKFIRSFVYLYQLRFDNKLKVGIEISDGVLERLVAPMTLQLLVENAVKHNVISVKKPLEISVMADETGYLTIRNNLQKKTTGVVSSEIGLKNIISRYAYLTDKPVEVTETDSEFIVKVPLI